VVSRVADAIIDSSNKVPELYAMLLSNITSDIEGVNKLLQVGDPLMGFYVTKLLELLFKKPLQNDTYAWIAGILNNVTQIAEGRSFLLDKKRGFFQLLFPHVESKNILRKRGTLGAIRNSLFESSFHEALLSDPEDTLLCTILLPLRGPEELDKEDTEGMPQKLVYTSPGKTRESNTEIRTMLVDCVLLLTSTKFGREKLRAKKVYPILREYDKVEEIDEIKNNIFNIVNVLVGLDENHKVNIDINPATMVSETDFIKEDEDDSKPSQTDPKMETPVPKKEHKPTPPQDSDEEGDKIEVI